MLSISAQNDRDPIQSRRYWRRYGQSREKKRKRKIRQIAADIELCRANESFPAIFVEASSRYIVTKLPILDSVLTRNASPGPLNEPRGGFPIIRTKMVLHIYFNLMRVRVRACFYPVIIFVQCRREKAGPMKSIEKHKIWDKRQRRHKIYDYKRR